jgi:hypothetical protein
MIRLGGCRGPSSAKLSFAAWWCNVPILKNDGVKVTGKDDIPYMKWNNWKIKAMFETTNQIEISFALRHRLLISMSPNGHRSCEVYILYTGPMGRS